MTTTRKMPRITRFVNLAKKELTLLPGKITRLHDKWSRGLPVPSRGFVIWPTVVGDIIRFKDGELLELPVEVRDELLTMYRQMEYQHTQTRVAVRGALSVEDQAQASWAGGSESPTNILGEEDFLAAVMTCIRETFNGNMDNYAKQMGVDGDMQLFILVQDMAVTDAFAIVFTSNPLTGSPDELLVQSTFGGGELLTSGDESGDVFTLDRNGKVLSSQVMDKRLMVTPEGVVDMPAELCSTPSLTESQLAQLAEFALWVETIENGQPQDCEIPIAFDGNGGIACTLVQNRPVTTEINTTSVARSRVIDETAQRSGKTLDEFAQVGCKAPYDVLSDQNIAELLTQRPTRFSFGLFTYIFAHGDAGIRRGRNLMGYDIGNELNDGFFQLVGGQARVSIIKDALTYRIAGIPLEDYFHGFVLRYLDQIEADHRLANYPEVVLYQQQPTLDELVDMFGHDKGARYHRCYQSFFAGIRRLEATFADDFTTKLRPDLQSHVNEQSQINWQSLPTDRLVGAIQSNLDYLRTKACVWFVIIARLGFFAYARLRRDLERIYGKEQAAVLLDKLTSGLSNDPTTQFHILLAKMRDGQTDIDELMRGFGHLGFNELEISGPRFHENPDIFETMAKQMSGNPARELEAKIQEMETNRQTVLDECDLAHRDDLAKDIESARTYLVMREWAKHHYLQIYDLLRDQLLALQEQMGWEEGDVFYLDPREVHLTVSNPDRAAELIRSRKEQSLQDQQVDIPQVIFTHQLEAIGNFEVPEDATELEGIGVTSYVCEGTARIVTDPKDKSVVESIREGDILVAPTTDPTWSAIMASLGFGKGGLVTEVGGPLAHGAVIARELHLGAVLNVAHATKIIKDGQRIRVDGPAGKVYLL